MLAAFGLGFVAQRGRLPPLVGYLVAGVVLHGFGYGSTAAVEEISGFYRTYHSIRQVGSRLVLRLHREVGDEELESLNDRFGHILAKGRFERIDATEAERRDDDHLELHRLAFRFDKRSWAGVRQMIDALNAAS